MFLELQSALQRVLHDLGKIPPQDVDVRFEPPTREFTAALVRPTVSLFLYDVRENNELRSTNLETTRANGRATYRVPPRRFDLRFLVSALTTVVEDEHLLLERTLVTLMKHPTFPEELLPEPLRSANPPLAAQVMKPEDEGGLLEVWSGLDARPRPALLYVVTVPVSLDLAFEAPLVLTRRTRYTPLGSLPTAPEGGTSIGGVVSDRSGNRIAGAIVSVEGSAAAGTLTSPSGEFTLARVPTGAVTLRVERAGATPQRVRIEIPAESYELVVE